MSTGKIHNKLLANATSFESNMAACEEIIRAEFPQIDDDLFYYVKGNTYIIKVSVPILSFFKLYCTLLWNLP